jgi:hypothetical protein
MYVNLADATPAVKYPNGPPRLLRLDPRPDHSDP